MDVVVVSQGLWVAVTGLWWLGINAWMRHSGWRIQAQCLSESGVDPLPRRALSWVVALVGAVMVVVCHREVGACAPVVVAMVGGVSAVVDARCHRLPTRYTAVMAAGVVGGLLACMCEVFLEAPSPHAASVSLVGSGFAVLTGIVVWTVPLGAGHVLHAGVGMGDVRLAPVLGAMLGTLGWEAAVSGLVLSFLSGGAIALWRLASGPASLHTRIAMGPSLIGGSLVSYLGWSLAPLG